MASAAWDAPPPPPPDVVPRLVTLEERASIIRSALTDTPVVVLQDLLEDLSDRVVVAVTFLAMLELMKLNRIAAVQDDHFGAIIIEACEVEKDGIDAPEETLVTKGELL